MRLYGFLSSQCGIRGMTSALCQERAWRRPSGHACSLSGSLLRVPAYSLILLGYSKPMGEDEAATVFAAYGSSNRSATLGPVTSDVLYRAKGRDRQKLKTLNDRAPPGISGWPKSSGEELPPSLQHHYSAFITTTRQSAPLRRIGTFGLAVVAACAFSLTIAGQVLTFRTRGWSRFAPPTRRMPIGWH